MATIQRRVVSWVLCGAVAVLGVNVQDAFASSLFVFTTNATSITKTTAVLNAYTTGVTTSSDVSFEYGTSRSFGSQTGSIMVRATGEQANVKLTGLEPGTRYYFRAIISGGGATDKGTTLSFTTIAQYAHDPANNDNDTTNNNSGNGGSSVVRPAVSTLQPSGVSDWSAIFNATVGNPNGGDVKVWFQYGIEAGNLVSTRTQRLSGTQFAASEAVTGLNPGTLYFVRAVAQNATGMTIGDIRSFQTTGTGTGTPPPAGSGGSKTLTALTYGTTRLSSSSYRLSGAALTSGEAGNAWIEWGTSVALGKTTPTMPIAANTTLQISRDITGLAAGKTYYYRAVVKTASGSARGATLSFVVARGTPSGGSGSPLDVDTSKDPVTLTLTVTKNGKDTDGAELNITTGDRVSVLLTAVNTGNPTQATVSLEMPQGLSFLGGDGASFDEATHVVTIAAGLQKGVTEKTAEFIANAMTGDASLRAKLRMGLKDIYSNTVLLKVAGASVSGGTSSGFWSGILGSGGACSLLWILIIVLVLAFGMIKMYTWLIEKKREQDEKEPPPTIKLPE